MLFPHELQTNILYAEAVTSISWRVFVLSSSAYQKALDPQVAAFEYLSVAWSDLVKHGYLAQYDCGSGVLWAFELPKICRKQASTSDTTKVLNMLSQQVLRQVDCGTLQASELEHTQRRPLQSATSNVRSGLDTSQSPRSYNLDSNGDRQQNEQSPFIKFGRYDVYNAFTNALLDTLSYKLTVQHRAIPLCFNLLLFNLDVSITAESSPIGSVNGTDTSHLTFSEHPVHIGADWLPDGRVICAIWRSSVAYRPIPTWPAQESISTTGEAILAPFGLKVPTNKLQNISFERSTHSHGDRLKRDAISEMLLQRGIKLNSPREWVSCDLRDETRDVKMNENTHSLLWPRELIFVVDSPAADMTGTTWADPRLIVDPFSVAFDFQGLRVPDSMEEDDLETPKFDDPSLPVDLYADMLSDMLGPNLASSIYPTPPELTRLQGSLHREKVEFSAPTPATTTSGFGNGLEETEMSPEHARGGLYDDMDADDLFGDLDMDLHNDVLNEDEFGFFDTTQKIGEVHKQPGDAMAPTELVVDLLEKPRHSKDKTVKFEPQFSEHESTEHSADHQALILNVDMLNAASGVESVEFLTRTPRPNPARKFQDKRMDEKYKTGGLFNVSPTDLPDMHDPRTQPPSRFVIPLITVAESSHALTDTSSGTSSTSDSDSESDSDLTPASNKDDEVSDGSMQGVVGTQNQRSKAVTDSTKDESFPLLELVSHRRPISTANLELSIDNFRRLSASLDLDGRQYMDLAHLVAYQICHWPASEDSLRSVDTDQKSMRPVKGGRGAGFGCSNSCTQSSDLPAVKSRHWNTRLQLLVPNLPISEQIHLALSESFSYIGRSSLYACVEFEPGQAATSNHNDLAQSPGLWERNSINLPEEQAAQLRTANVVLCREETKVVMSATALSLWVELGLGPIGKTKYISAYCFAPGTDVWIHGASAFLQTTGEIFSLLKLGEHLPGPKMCPESPINGVVAVESSDSLQTYLQNLCRSLNGFGHRLVQQEQLRGTVMIYIACPCEDTLAVPFFCAAFQRLNRLVLSKHRSHRWNLQLRVLPRSIFVRNFAFNPLSMAKARTLGREVFDLCHQTETPSNQDESLASLARPLPGRVGFQLQPNSNRRPLDTHLITHVSYSWKPGNPWVSFAFCDDVGGRRWHNSYYLPWEASNGIPQSQGQTQPGTPTTPSVSSSGYGAANMWRRFVAIARDVLKSLAEVSEDLMQSQLHTHYVFLVRDGSITREEMRVWRWLMEQTAKPNGVVSILGTHNSGNSGAANSSATFSAVLMNWTIAVLDCECPLELCQPGTQPDDREHPSGLHPSGGDHTRQWASDLPASTPGTPSLASPGLPSGSLAGSFPRDPEDRNARLVASDSLAWFLPARSIVVQGSSGKLEVLPTWSLPTPPGTGPLGARAAVISGGGYLLMPDANAGVQDSAELSGERMPKVLSLRIMAAKGPSLMDLRQLAEAYRGLATMADILGLGATLPWHVSMARRSRIGLGECM